MAKQDEGSQTTPEQKTNNEAELAEVLKKLNITGEQLKAAVEAGLVIPKPSKVDELPDSLKKEIEELIRHKEQDSEEILKKQLYGSIEKIRKDNEELRKTIEERESKIREEEQARLKAEQDEAAKKLSLEQKLEMQREAMEKAQAELQIRYEERFNELQKAREMDQLVAMREKLILETQVQELSEFIPDPSKGPTSAEQIQQAVKIAREKLDLLKPKTTETTTQTQTTPQGGRVPPGNGHLRNTDTSFTEDQIRTASKGELDRMKEEVFKKYSLS